MCKRRKSAISFILAALLMVSLSGCQSAEAKPKAPIQEATAMSKFAAYQEVLSTVKPSLEPYTVSAGLSNVTNKDDFAFSSEAESYLVKNGFVVIPGDHREFFGVYEANRYEQVPSFITTDSMLHNYHLYFSYLLRTLEKDYLYGELEALTASMLEKSQEHYNTLKATDWETAAKRNVAFFAVAASILDSNASVPSFVKDQVSAELSLINSHTESFTASPVMNIGISTADSSDSLNEDYTQYVPRGHYTKSDELKTYFKAMMWYGRMTFRASNPDETKSAALTTLLMSDQINYSHWDNIYEPTNFLVGKSDDLGFIQYHQVLNQVYGNAPDLKALTSDTKKWDSFYAQVQKLEAPAVNSIPILNEDIQPDRDTAITGFRFMGQRFTPDAAMFQRLLYRDVKENSSGSQRTLPKALDIPAAMGSKEAYSILTEMGETDYKNYPENMKKLQEHNMSLDTKAQTQTLYGAWLYTLSPLTLEKGKGYPSFMQNQAWTRKQLEAYLSSWTELKHDTVLYAKQVYAEMGGGDEPKDDRGYVEPNPEVYGRLAAMSRMTIDGLQGRKLLNDNTAASLEQLETLSLKLKVISEKELVGEVLSDEEYDLIRSFGGQLEHLWLEALRDEGVESSSSVYNHPAALVTDVATDPNGRVLENATGYISNIYVVVPVDGTLRLAKGATYSYYEFPWPSNDRLTDEKWKNILSEDMAPPAPDWTKLYTAPKGSSEW